jgi:hypothetical protein
VFSSLKVHISREHTPGVQNTSVPLEVNHNVWRHCSRPECSDRTFEVLSELKKHLNAHLTKKEEIECPFQGCCSKFNVKSSFSSHLSRKHFDICEISLTSARNQVEIQGDAEPPQAAEPEVEPFDNLEDFLCDDTVENDNNYLRQLALFYLKLQGKYLLPVSTIQTIITEFEDCHDMSQIILTKKLCSKLESLEVSPEVILAVKHEIESGDLFANCNKGPLKTAAKRSAFYHKHFAFCDPVEVFLGLDDQLKRRTYQYVPICQSIANLYRHYASHFHFFSKANNADENYHLCDISDGQVFKRNSIFSDKKAVAIILYQDAFEVVNPLGSAKKSTK